MRTQVAAAAVLLLNTFPATARGADTLAEIQRQEAGRGRQTGRLDGDTRETVATVSEMVKKLAAGKGTEEEFAGWLKRSGGPLIRKFETFWGTSPAGLLLAELAKRDLSPSELFRDLLETDRGDASAIVMLLAQELLAKDRNARKRGVSVGTIGEVSTTREGIEIIVACLRAEAESQIATLEADARPGETALMERCLLLLGRLLEVDVTPGKLLWDAGWTRYWGPQDQFAATAPEVLDARDSALLSVSFERG